MGQAAKTIEAHKKAIMSSDVNDSIQFDPDRGSNRIVRFDHTFWADRIGRFDSILIPHEIESRRSDPQPPRFDSISGELWIGSDRIGSKRSRNLTEKGAVLGVKVQLWALFSRVPVMHTYIAYLIPLR